MYVEMCDKGAETPRQVTPRLSASIGDSGGFLYMLSAARGLLKLGTGYSGTVLGRLYAQNLEMCVHAGGSVVCVGAGRVLVRSPLLPQDQLLVLCGENLSVLPLLVKLKTSFNRPTATSIPGASEWTLEFERNRDKWESLDTLARGCVEHVRKVLVSTPWSFGNCLQLSDQWNLLLSDDGWLLLRRGTKRAGNSSVLDDSDRKMPDTCRVRVRWRHCLSPFLNDWSNNRSVCLPMMEHCAMIARTRRCAEYIDYLFTSSARV